MNRESMETPNAACSEKLAILGRKESGDGQERFRSGTVESDAEECVVVPSRARSKECRMNRLL